MLCSTYYSYYFIVCTQRVRPSWFTNIIHSLSTFSYCFQKAHFHHHAQSTMRQQQQKIITRQNKKQPMYLDTTTLSKSFLLDVILWTLGDLVDVTISKYTIKIFFAYCLYSPDKTSSRQWTNNGRWSNLYSNTTIKNAI